MELSEEQKKQLEEQKQHCPFCKIVSGEIPSQKVYEDDLVLAILDINPFKKGHTLVLPKEHFPIMPLLPKETFNHLFGLIPEMSTRLKDAMLSRYCYTYVANGAAAGQQAGHFMIHLIPSDSPIEEFSPEKKPVDQKAYEELERVLEHNLPLMMRDRNKLFATENEQAPAEDRSKRLAELLEENPDFKATLIENPDAVRAGIQENPSLKELFEGVDIDALSKKLADVTKQPQEEQEDALPRAVDLSDKDLKLFVNAKPKLKDLLLNDLDTLKQAISQQERLQRFFESTTPEQVASRIQDEKLGLEDLAR